MRRKVPKSILGLLVLCTVLVIGFILGDIYEQNSTETAANISKVSQSLPTRAELLKLVNAERAKVGVKPLVEDPRLDASAQIKAQDEIDNNYFGHERPGSKDFVGADLINATGIKCIYESENLQRENYGPNTAKADVASWMTSKPHREAILDGRYTLTGFGISGDEIVEHFCQQP